MRLSCHTRINSYIVYYLSHTILCVIHYEDSPIVSFTVRLFVSPKPVSVL